jgi:hypothetical protein
VGTSSGANGLKTNKTTEDTLSRLDSAQSGTYDTHQTHDDHSRFYDLGIDYLQFLTFHHDFHSPAFSLHSCLVT